jgi:hypothetical protein
MSNWRNTYLSDDNVRARCVTEFPTPQSINYATIFQKPNGRKIAQAPINPVKAMQNMAQHANQSLSNFEQAYQDSVASAKRESLNVTYWNTPAKQMIDRPVYGVAVSRANRQPSGNSAGGSSNVGPVRTTTYEGSPVSSLDLIPDPSPMRSPAYDHSERPPLFLGSPLRALSRRTRPSQMHPGSRAFNFGRNRTQIHPDPTGAPGTSSMQLGEEQLATPTSMPSSDTPLQPSAERVPSAPSPSATPQPSRVPYSPE